MGYVGQYLDGESRTEHSVRIFGEWHMCLMYSLLAFVTACVFLSYFGRLFPF